METRETAGLIGSDKVEGTAVTGLTATRSDQSKRGV
jgi:hypothetical protein